MSGGVDSSVAALLLKSQGHDVIGVYMRNWDQLGDQSCTDACSVDEDLEDMRRVCRTLDIPAHTVDLSRDYWVDVFAPLVDAYSTGRLTPNPDVDCNRYIKFDKFLRLCLSRWGVDYVATGHYARLVDKTGDNGDTYRALLRGTDELKDQSYFLSMTQVRC
jgi:tRNA-specific 2-thiouridylase